MAAILLAFLHRKLPCTMAGDVEEHEAVQNSQFTMVRDGEQATKTMGLEVHNCRLAAGNQCSGTGEQSQHNQKATRELDDAGNKHPGFVNRHMAAEQLLPAMIKDEKPGNDSEQREGKRLNATQRFHRLLSLDLRM